MLRKTHIAGFISFVLTTPGFAGLYVGADIGPEALSISQKAHVIRAGTLNVIDKNRFSGLGVFGSIFVGLSCAYKYLFLAAEINGTMSSVRYKYTNDEYIHRNFARTTFTIRDSEGVSALPGFFISDHTVLYGRIGWATGKIKLIEGADPTIQSAHTRRAGLRWGLGIRHRFNEQFAFMMEFSQITYQRLHSWVFEPNGGVSKDTMITPRTGQVAFGLIYHFDVPPPPVPVYVK